MESEIVRRAVTMVRILPTNKNGPKAAAVSGACAPRQGAKQALLRRPDHARKFPAAVGLQFHHANELRAETDWGRLFGWLKGRIKIALFVGDATCNLHVPNVGDVFENLAVGRLCKTLLDEVLES